VISRLEPRSTLPNPTRTTKAEPTSLPFELYQPVLKPYDQDIVNRPGEAAHGASKPGFTSLVTSAGELCYFPLCNLPAAAPLSSANPRGAGYGPSLSSSDLHTVFPLIIRADYMVSCRLSPIGSPARHTEPVSAFARGPQGYRSCGKGPSSMRWTLTTARKRLRLSRRETGRPTCTGSKSRRRSVH
jgi:hypothetical protein